ncbi:MAG: hypothetical protein ABI671_12115 [Burkholderiales bacterium]
MSVAALFTRSDSIYRELDVECFGATRDARTFDLACPVVAHPPCRAWSRLRHFAKPRADEKDLARWALFVVRHCGGVLEHPSGSTLFKEAGLPEPGSTDRDAFGGFVLPLSQKWFGHRAEKRTWLYIVGIDPGAVPRMPLVLGDAERTCGLWGGRDRARARKEIGPAEREHTPPAFARWLVDLARACEVAA